MVMDNKRLVMTVMAFAGIIAGILFVNRWIDREMKDLALNPIEKSVAPQPVEKPQQTTQKPRPILIDPNNDPLSPVIARKQLKSSAQKAAPRPTSPQKIYEPAEENVILVQ